MPSATGFRRRRSGIASTGLTMKMKGSHDGGELDHVGEDHAVAEERPGRTQLLATQPTDISRDALKHELVPGSGEAVPLAGVSPLDFDSGPVYSAGGLEKVKVLLTAAEKLGGHLDGTSPLGV